MRRARPKSTRRLPPRAPGPLTEKLREAGYTHLAAAARAAGISRQRLMTLIVQGVSPWTTKATLDGIVRAGIEPLIPGFKTRDVSSA